MMRALTTAGTGMVSQQYNLDTIANNLANVNTTAFKQLRAEFQDLMYETARASGVTTVGTGRAPGPIQIGMGSRFASSAASMKQGPVSPSNNPTDLAINGEGFFVVARPGGEVAYTRDGAFRVDAEGVLVTGEGLRLQPEIRIEVGTTAISISSSGVVSGTRPGANESEEIGQITIAVFPNPAGLTRNGNNLFEAGGGSGEPQIVVPGENGSGYLQSGFLEGSNVQVVDEMVKMITAQRAYEINSKAIMTADEMLGIISNLKR